MAYVRWSLALLALAAALVLLTFGDYGVTWDEEFHVRYGNGVLDYIASGFTDRAAFQFGNLYYYGAAFDLLCAVGSRISPLELYDTRHLLNALVALVGGIGCWFLARELGGPRTALIAAVLLVLTPRWWGHGFNNPKDIPFAAGYVWSMVCLARLMPTLPQVPTRLALATGVAIGLTLAIRVGGLMLFGYLGLAILLSVRKTWPFHWNDVRSLALGFATIVTTAWTVMLAFWPWTHSRPLTAPLEAFQVMSNFPWRGTMLFAGNQIHATQIPASYLSHWLVVTLPEILLIGLVLALWVAWREGERFGFVAFAALFPLIYIAIQRPIVYDGMRHVLFVVPLLCALAARALEVSFERARTWRPQLARAGWLLVSIYIAYHISIMVRLHPNQYVYFNAFVGGLPGAYGHYETDYWGNSNREAVARLVDHIESEEATPSPYRVFVCSPTPTTLFPDYLSSTRQKNDADFLVGTTRYDCHRSMEGKELAVVERLGTPLNFVVDRRHLVERRRGQRIYGNQVVLPKNLHQTIRNDRNPNLDELIQFSTNSIGLRGPEPPREFDSSLTVVAIGGSTTECLFLSNGKSWPEVVGGFLAPTFNPLWVNNAGLDGHSSFSHLFLLDQIVGPMRPKVAVFLIGINDVGQEDATERSRPRSAIMEAVINLRRHGEAKGRDLEYVQIDLAARLISAADHNLSASLLGAHREQYVPSYKDRIETIVRISREYGIEPVLISQPALYGVAADPLTLVNLNAVVVSDVHRTKAGQVRGKLAWDVLELYNDAVRAVGRERDVLVIDAASRLPKSSQLFYDFVHFTNEGARELARIVSEDLCSFLAKRFPDFVVGPCPVIEPLTVGGNETIRAIANQLNGVIDLGNEPNFRYALVGDGWFEPVVEDGVDFRRSRGRRSWLNVPIVPVRDQTLVFKARSELVEVPLTARVHVNGHHVGTMELSEGWTEYTFDVSADSLVAGLNTITLLYSDTPRTIEPGFRGRNTSIALDWVRYEAGSAR